MTEQEIRRALAICTKAQNTASALNVPLWSVATSTQFGAEYLEAACAQATGYGATLRALLEARAKLRSIAEAIEGDEYYGAECDAQDIRAFLAEGESA